MTDDGPLSGHLGNNPDVSRQGPDLSHSSPWLAQQDEAT
ncbi:hypothetical protein Gbro_1370 [Gordonia bronchialis DSM 43247]|uniref:Uncharacterized protein n=1 Tax=Gordonia bronchialis (strain ATCC 25592 / DSM 43247 / BCRC 13721 / JCM 3198 / KCTC 3076 / NBRC 16047 / NCTC 10667) TaxID=526226 RepID=D0L697_GORB4|nr:hypothetical protein Gbro_1370 [Gordonia bronchialis DSM 43247]